jgi:hypothetical protein
MVKLRKYWFRFQRFAKPTPLNLGCGVTAYNYDDALALLAARVFLGEPVPPIAQVIEDVDISTLDPKHVLPNLETPVQRGVWFPKGYTENSRQ